MNLKFKVKILEVLMIVCLIGSFSTYNAYGFGMGFYGTGDLFGTFDATMDNGDVSDTISGLTVNEYDKIEIDGDSQFFGGGLVLDTNVKKDRLFNYRLQLGYETGEYQEETHRITNLSQETFDSTVLPKWNLSHIYTDHTFGFGIVRNDVIRLFIGPKLRLEYLTGDIESQTQMRQGNFDVKAIGLGIGPVIGMNIHLPVVSLCFDIGARYTAMFGEFDYNYGYSGVNGQVNGNYDLSLRETAVYCNMLVIFRMGSDL